MSSDTDPSNQDNNQSGDGNNPVTEKAPSQNRILKILLNQQDDDDYTSEHVAKLRTSPCAPPKPSGGTGDHKPNASSGNNMLLQLLNEKSDDDDEEARAGLKKRHELLQQLLKESDNDKKLQDHKSRDDDPLLRSLGFRNASPSSSQAEHALGLGQKRPGPDESGDMTVATKRLIEGTQVTSSATGTGPNNSTSKLWEKNRMLASLLAKQPTQPATIPPIPASVISATPQDKLPQVIDRNKQQQLAQLQQQQQPWAPNVQSMLNNPTANAVASARTPLQNQSRQLPRQATNVYLNQVRVFYNFLESFIESLRGKKIYS